MTGGSMAKVLHGGERATDRPRKLFVQTFGVEGTGKTSLSLSFPSPLWMMNLDRNMDDLLEKLPPHYEIHYEESLPDVDMSAGMAAKVLMTFEKLFDEAMASGKGTLIVDGSDLLWEYVKMAKLPPDADVPNQWGPANSKMESYFRRAERGPIHVVFNTIASNVWEGMNKETKKMKADGFKHAPRFINTKVYMFTPEDYSTPMERPQAGRGSTHSSFIATSKLNEKIQGAVFVDLSFKILYKAIFGELPPDHEKLWTPSSNGT